MAIAVSGVTVALREIKLRDKPADMLDVSPKGTVPVLVLQDGSVIDESIDIMHWALAQSDPLGWRMHEDAALIAANDGPFKAALDRYKYPHRYGLADGILARQAAMPYLHAINDRIGNAPTLAGEQPDFTDIALAPFIRQFAATDREWFGAQDFPALQGWLEQITGSELFTASMERFPVWQVGDTERVFP
jgi:glutathione S-transferase